MRCPQCGRKVPVDLSTIQVVSEDVMILQLKCHECEAYVVLQASLQGIDKISAPPYEVDAKANASTELESGKHDLRKVRAALQKVDGSFEKLFTKPKKKKEGAHAETDIV